MSIELILGAFIWYTLGFVLFAWSMDWKIKGNILFGCGIAITGPLCFAQALKVKGIL